MLGETRSVPVAVAAAPVHVAGASLAKAPEGISGPGPLTGADRPEAGPLVLHEGIGNSEVRECARWPEKLRLESTLGQLVKGRCKATNLCAYCARLAAVENSELLALDAAEGIAPQVWMVLGTGTDELDPAHFYAARKYLMTKIRERFGRQVEWAALVEFTTGYSVQSGGRRFPHWNILLKGIAPEQLDALRELVVGTDREPGIWCRRKDFKAAPDAQHVGSITAAGGLMKYLALHFQKEEQSPPEDWRGHRFLKSDGYLWLPTPAAREAAKQSLRLNRELWRAMQSGLHGQVAEEAAHLALYEANELAWQLVRLEKVPTAFDADGMPTAWDEITVEVRP